MGRQDDVAVYYNENTRRFLRSKHDRENGSIHRMLFAPGISSRAQALQYVHILVRDHLLACRPERVLDLGCGVGGTIRYLQNVYPADYCGITISKAQVKIAEEFGTPVEHADFLDTEWFKQKQPFHFIYAIESVQHNPDHSHLLNNLRISTEKDSMLLVIDDFVRPVCTDSGKLSTENSRRLAKLKARFKKRWHASGFEHVRDFISVCNAAGFILEDIEDLSKYMKNSWIWNRIQLGLSFVLQLHPSPPSWAENIIGGNALKLMQEDGFAGYYKMLFRRM